MNHKREIDRQLNQSSSVFADMVSKCGDSMNLASNMMIEAIENGNKILWCGNGGSAAQAQHLSTELVGGLRDHASQAIPSISLTTDTSFLTAWSNDTNFNSVFSRQISALGQKGDVLMWDNRCSMHYAIYDYGIKNRLMYRTTPAADKPF